MLIKCPECGLQASDKAYNCPHCGYPFQKNHNKPKIRKSNKRRRLPNGFGQISELKGRNLRKPFRAMVTVSKNDKGRPVCKLLQPNAYFSTYNEAYEALVKYNKNPYDLSNGMTMNELFEKWTEEHFKVIKTESTRRSIKAAWNYCWKIYDMKIVDIRPKHIRECLYNSTVVYRGKEQHITPNTIKRLKFVFNLMFDYAIEYELTDRNYARMITLAANVDAEAKAAAQKHIPFTDAEMSVLWGNLGLFPYVDMILIHCYSGWRPKELINLKLSDVDLEDNSMTGGMKTDAGKDRYVPIHPRIRPLIVKRYETAKKYGSEYLFDRMYGGKYQQVPYRTYLVQFDKVVELLKLNPNHLPHDPRTTFVTMAKKYNMDEYAIKYIVGHAITDVTERVYTTRDKEWLQEQMKKIR